MAQFSKLSCSTLLVASGDTICRLNIVPQWGLLSLKRERTDPFLRKKEIFLCAGWRFLLGKNLKMILSRNSLQNKLCFTSIFLCKLRLNHFVLHFLAHESEKGRGGLFFFFLLHWASNISPKQGLFQVAWDQNELISKPAERDLWWEFVEG